MLNILVVADGTSGDVHPLLGISTVLASQGHSVTFFTNAVFADLVERCGLRFVAAGTAAEYHALQHRATVDDALQLSKAVWKSLLNRVRPVFDLLVSEAGDNTVIVAHPWALGARLVQEKHGVPLVTLHVSPATILSAKLPPIHKPCPIPLWLPYSVRSALLWALDRGVLDRLLGPDINRLRFELGLPPVTRIAGRWIHSPQGVLGLFPDWFASAQADWPANISLTGFPLFDEGNLRSLDLETEEFLAKGPPTVFTVGSTRIDEIGYYATAATAVKALGLRAIFLTSQKLPALGPNILVRPYLPLSRLLPRARAIVHHGGIGTVSQALAAGIPQLITPFVYDQFDNAVRLERLGCGIQLDSGTSFARNMLPRLQRLLESEQIHQRCLVLRSRVDSASSARRNAFSAIENIASETLSKTSVVRPDPSCTML